jgi:hypothetical protein
MGKLVGFSPFASPKSHELQQLPYSPLALTSGNPVEPQAVGDVGIHGHVGKEGIALEEKPHVAPLGWKMED